MKEDIRQLTELQVIDLQIASLDQEIGAGQADLDKRKSDLEERQAAIAELKKKIAEADARRRALEAEHADELTRIKERQSKMMQVQTNREYQSLLKEIEDGKKGNKEKEEEIVKVLEQIDSYEKIIKEESGLCDAEAKSLAKESAKIESLAADINKKKAGIVKKRDGMAKVFSPVLLSKYNKLRERRNGKAVVGVKKGVCQGCFMNIPPQQYNEILRGDRMLFCPTCQRILYHQPEKS